MVTVTGETVKSNRVGIAEDQIAGRQICNRIASANRDGVRGLETRSLITDVWLSDIGVAPTQVDCGDGRMGIGQLLTGVVPNGRITLAGLPQENETYEAICAPLKTSRDGFTVPALVLGTHTYCKVDKTIDGALAKLGALWGIMPRYTTVKATDLESGRIEFATMRGGRWVWFDINDLARALAQSEREEAVITAIIEAFGWDDADGKKVARFIAEMMIYNQSEGHLVRRDASMAHEEVCAIVGFAPSLDPLSAAAARHSKKIFGISLGGTEDCWRRELEYSLPVAIDLALERSLDNFPIGFWSCDAQDPIGQLRLLDEWASPVIEQMVAAEKIPEGWCIPFFVRADPTSLMISDDCFSREQLYLEG